MGCVGPEIRRVQKKTHWVGRTNGGVGSTPQGSFVRPVNCNSVSAVFSRGVAERYETRLSQPCEFDEERWANLTVLCGISMVAWGRKFEVS